MEKDRKNKYVEFIVLTAIVLLTRIFDLTTTWLITPNLDFEFNPYVGLLNLKWKGFILFQIVIAAFVIAVNYISLFVVSMVYPEQKGLSLNKFQLFYMFGNVRDSHGLIKRLVTIAKINVPFLGYLLPRLIIFVSFFVGLLHCLILFEISLPAYSFYLFYAELVVAIFVFIGLHTLKHYRIYKEM
jgi:hypothetical protein